MRNRFIKASALAVCLAGFAVSGALADGMKVVAGPSSDPECMKPYSKDTKFFQWAKKPGPYRIALDNGFVANDWRVQMIKVAKAYADQHKDEIKEFKVISTGEDLPAQVAAADNFIDAGFDAVIVDALNPSAFAPVVKHANKVGTVLLSFDNVIESPDAVEVNVDQKGLGVQAGDWLLKNIKSDGGKLLEVRGPAGNSVDRDRHDGFHEALDKSGKKWEVVEVVGKWDPGTAQKVTADAIAVHKKFDGIYVQGGSQGVVQAMIDAKHPFVPVSGETENGFRKMCAQYADQGLHCWSGGTGPAQVAVTIKAAVEALQGSPIPQNVSLPTSSGTWPNMKDGQDFYSKLPDAFFVGNNFPTCKIGFTAEEINAKTGAND